MWCDKLNFDLLEVFIDCKFEFCFKEVSMEVFY